MMKRWEFYDVLIKRMESLYREDVPEIVIKRYVREKNHLQLSEFHEEFMEFAELLMELQQNQIKYSMIGTASHSFLLYLWLQSEMNPLPPHYYCPQCKKIVFIDRGEEISMGIDLPRMRCECGCELRGDGFDLPESFFWEKEELDLKVSVGAKDYDFVKEWLSRRECLQDKKNKEEDYDDENIVKKYNVGIITVLAEKTELPIKNEIGWDEVRKHKEKVIENYELILPCKKKIKYAPQSLYEVIRIVAFFSTMYTKSTECYVGEEDILDVEDMYLLLEKCYNNDISKVPVFQEDGLMMGEWNVEDYNFRIMFTRAFAEYVLHEINDKMSILFDEGT